jgi:hypothetical protein
VFLPEGGPDSLGKCAAKARVGVGQEELGRHQVQLETVTSEPGFDTGPRCRHTWEGNSVPHYPCLQIGLVIINLPHEAHKKQ